MAKLWKAMLACMIILQGVVVSVWTEQAHAAPSGTLNDPYIILTADDLSDIRLNLSAHYRLGANIDLADYDHDGAGPDTGGWMPIGAVNDTTSNAFTGSLDGNGYTISNMKINRPSMQFVGLFGSIDGAALLRDIRLPDIQVIGNSIVGGIVGSSVNGTISSSYATGTTRVTGQAPPPYNVAVNAGGLVGLNVNGVIENSYAVVDVSGWNRLGGLAGTNFGTIRNAYAAGRVTGYEEIGGLVGYNSGGTIVNAYAAGSSYGSMTVGGLVGRNDTGGTASSSYWNEDTTGLAGSALGAGMTSEQMKDAATFGWDPSMWGIVEGETYPYLRAFGMGIGVDPLAATTYSLQPGQDAVSVTGSVYHETAMEPIDVRYIIRDSNGTAITEALHTTSGSSALRSINRRFELSGYANGSYTLTVLATDSHRTAVGSTLTFTVDAGAAAPPTVQFTNNNGAWTQSASTTVTVSDSGGGIDASTSRYSWSTDSATPGPGSIWTSFASGDTLSRTGVNGEVYLHIRVKDNSGNTANVASNRFRLDIAAPTVHVSMAKDDSTEYGNDTWTNQPVTVSYSATDANGVALNDYSIDGGTTWIPYTGAIILQDDGIHSVSLRAVDEAGNETIVQRTVKVSASGLMLTPTLTVQSGSAYTSGSWTNESVTASVYAEAGLSGMASLTYTLGGGAPQGYVNEDPIVVSQEGQHAMQFHLADGAGNTMSASLIINIDMTAPSVGFGMNGSETLAQTASTTVTVTDTASGVDHSSLEYAWSSDTTTPAADWTSFANGDTLSRSGVSGDAYLYIRAQDLAGNTTDAVSNRFRLRAAASYASEPTATKPVIDVNGTALDPGSIDLTKPSVTVDVIPKDGKAYVSIPANILLDFAGRNDSFFIEIATPYGSYQMPVNLAAFIPGLEDLLAARNLKAENISFKITLTDKSDDKDIQRAFADSLPKADVMGAIVDFHLEVADSKTGLSIGTVEQFNKKLTRVIPMPKSMNSMPGQWGAFRNNESTNKFEFVPARAVQVDGVWYVMIHSDTNSVYAVARNPVNFDDMSEHWGKPHIELAAAKGLIEGVGGDRFDPNQSITRAEFTAMLIRVLGYGRSTDTSSPYRDVQTGSWYFDIVVQATELGLLDFAGGSSFKPDQTLTREEMASMLAALIALEELPMSKEAVSLDGYKDVGNIDSAYLEDVQTIVTLNIMTGIGSDVFSPTGESTRAQAGVVLVRTLTALGMMD